jgi:hypothetical protein
MKNRNPSARRQEKEARRHGVYLPGGKPHVVKDGDLMHIRSSV